MALALVLTRFMNEHSSRRRRPALSCVQCRRRKIKCDRTNPCVHCTASKTSCVYKVYHNERTTQQSEGTNSLGPGSCSVPSIPSPSAATQPDAAANATSQHNSGSTESRPVIITPAPTERDDIQISNHVLNLETEVRELLGRVARLERVSAPDPARGSNDDSQEVLPTCRSGMFDAQSSLNKTRILRWSHWADEAPEVILALTRTLGLFADFAISTKKSSPV